MSEILAVARRHLRVHGVVQGVGFRSFVYQLALRHGVAGFVGNDEHGVVIEAEGEPDDLAAFVRAITAEAPPLAQIESIRGVACSPHFDAPGFEIVLGKDGGAARTTLIAPAQVIAVLDREGGLAKVDISGVRREVSIALVDGPPDPLQVGDWVLIHVGFAIARIDEVDARETLARLQRELGELKQPA